MSILSSPFFVTASEGLCCLPPQVANQRIPLFANVAESPFIRTRLLAGNKPEITGHLLAATKPIRSAQHQHKSQRRDRADSRMGLQPLYLGQLCAFFFDCLAQLVDVGIEAVQ